MANATVYFATNRQPNNQTAPSDFTTAAVGANEPIYFGRADFTGVDLTPEPDAESDNLLPSLGAKAALTIAPMTAVPQSPLGPAGAGLTGLAQINQNFANGHQDALFCFHGYDYTFRESLARAAQLQSWLSPDNGPPLLIMALAWPSLGGAISPATYAEERGRSQAAGPAMGRAVRELAGLARYIATQQVTTQNFQLLAHSMGNWALRWAVQSMCATAGGAFPERFDQVMLMAADEDYDSLGDDTKLKPLIGACSRLTVYDNRLDAALTASRWINGMPRLGGGGPSNWQALPANVSLVSAASVPDPQDDPESHQYYRISRYAQIDLLQVLAGTPDANVTGRTAVPSNGQHILRPLVPPPAPRMPPI